MHAYTLLAPAKINLYLEILGDRPDGFHELATIVQSVALSDRLEIRANGTQSFRLSCAHSQVPLDDSNLALRAAHLMAAQFPEAYANFGGIDIHIEKNIPVAAGLAGGSGNAAAVLVGLDLIWNLGLTQPELQALGTQLGSDVPFSIIGGTAIATGKGEKIASLPACGQLWAVLAKYDSIAISTPWAYQTYRHTYGTTYPSDRQEQAARSHRIHSGKLVHALVHHDFARIGGELYNDLEKVVLPEYPLVAELRRQMAREGGLGTLMSGSGPAVFTLCEDKAAAQAIARTVRSALPSTDLKLWVAELSRSGIQVL